MSGFLFCDAHCQSRVVVFNFLLLADKGGLGFFNLLMLANEGGWVGYLFDKLSKIVVLWPWLILSHKPPVAGVDISSSGPISFCFGLISGYLMGWIF